MNIDFNFEFDYNSPVIITYFIISAIALLMSYITRGKSNHLLFSNYRSSPLNPLTYLRLFTHCIGHTNWDHFVGNFLYILLIGPMIEEKYGSINLLIMFLLTSLITAIYNVIFNNYEIKGASGNVFMLIVLSSFSNFSEGHIPITLILVFIFYIVDEIKKSITEGNKKIYHDGHLIGAICGIAYGFLYLKYPDFLNTIIGLIK